MAGKAAQRAIFGLIIAIVVGSIRRDRSTLKRLTFENGQNIVSARTRRSSAKARDAVVDLFATEQVQCRREIESWQNDNIDMWITESPLMPWAEWVWELDDDLQRGVEEPYFVLLLWGAKIWERLTDTELLSRQWYWQDQFGNNFKASMYNGRQVPDRRLYLKMDPPVYNEKKTNTFAMHKISSTTHVHNFRQGNNKTKRERSIPAYVWSNSTNTSSRLRSIKYDVRPYVKCSQVDKQNPPPQHVKLGACLTRFWGQHDLMPEWLEYHRLIGIQHFWLFVQEDFDNFIKNSGMPRYASDITYIPYKYRWIDHNHVRKDGNPAFFGEALFQSVSNNQCVYMAKQYKLDWMFTPDVDEYVALENPVQNESFPLQRFLREADQNISICIDGSQYGKMHGESPNAFELTIDFTYRHNKSLSNKNGRKKCFFKPNTVTDVWVHGITVGEKGAYARKGITLNHYRSPWSGFSRYEKDLVSYPELRDRYRDTILQALKLSNLKLPEFKEHSSRGYQNMLSLKKKEMLEGEERNVMNARAHSSS